MRVLIVDDNHLTADALADFFHYRGNPALAVDDGPTALDVIGQQHPDAVVLDQKLPTMTGLEVLRTIRKTGSSLPVVMVTAVCATEVDALRKELVGLQPSSLVRKPATPDEILSAIESLSRGQI